jgi:adenylyl-sulfate kinase
MDNVSVSRGDVIWFTGLPCSGKTTLSTLIESHLKDQKMPVEHLDGDVVRQKLCKDLSFSKEDRFANIERVVFAADLLSRHGIHVVVSFVSPYRQMRDYARQQLPSFVEVYVRCPIQVCEARDSKGMYRKARAGEIKNFTGVSDPYEEPQSPEITVDTDRSAIDACSRQISDYLDRRWAGRETNTRAA